MKTIRALWLGALLALSLAMLVSHAAAQTAPVAAVIKNGSVVSMEYVLANDAGQVMDSNKGQEPMVYTQGAGQIIPGLERELNGLKAGDEKKVQVKPADGYGPVDPAAFQEVPKEMLPPEALKVGTILTARTPQGQPMPVRIHEIRETTVIVDFNHPMAGKTLFFEIKIIAVK